MTDKVSSSTVLELIARDLKQARIERNFSLDDISRQITIQKSYLEKIEEGDFSFLSRAYVFAYIKSYAQHLGVGNDELLEQCRQGLQLSGAPKTASADNGRSEERQKQPRNSDINAGESGIKKSLVSWKTGSAVIVLVLLAVVYMVGSSRFSAPPPAPPTVSLPSAAVEDTVAVAEQIVDSLLTTGDDKPPPVEASVHPAPPIAPDRQQAPVHEVTPAHQEKPIPESRPVHRETPVLQVTPTRREITQPDSRPVRRETRSPSATSVSRDTTSPQLAPAETAHPKALPQVRNKSSTVPVASTSDPPSAAATKDSKKVAEEGSPVRASPKNHKVLIVKVVKDYSWVKVVADDSAKVYPGGSFKSGQTLRYEASNKLWVNIGRPGYVELYLNGKKLPTFTSRILVFE
jgi:cytoskeletal protein RodZ